VRYAGGRPLWQLSISFHEQGKPVSLLRWSRTKWRKAEAVRDKVMIGAGTSEPWFLEQGVWSAHWRKPLSLAEVNQMANRPEVRAATGASVSEGQQPADLNSSGTSGNIIKPLFTNGNIVLENRQKCLSDAPQSG
jgi:hypothetical protein